MPSQSNLFAGCLTKVSTSETRYRRKQIKFLPTSNRLVSDITEAAYGISALEFVGEFAHFVADELGTEFAFEETETPEQLASYEKRKADAFNHYAALATKISAAKVVAYSRGVGFTYADDALSMDEIREVLNAGEGLAIEIGGKIYVAANVTLNAEEIGMLDKENGFNAARDAAEARYVAEQAAQGKQPNER